MDVSVIIAAGRPDLKRCLESLERQSGGLSYEVIVVGERGMARPSRAIVWMIANTSNPATKRNVGAEAAQGRYLAFIDDDAWAPQDWLQNICRALDADPKIAGVGGPNIPPEDASAAERLTDAVLSSKLGSGSGSYARGGIEHEAEIGEIHLANFAVQRDFFMQMGGFNETLGYGAEDSEFIYAARRLQRARFLYSPSVLVVHRRRAWGAALLHQRFHLRMQNGRLLWVRPEMYMGHPMFAAGLIGALLLMPLALMAPPAIAIVGLMYIGVLAFASGKTNYNGRFRWIMATAAVHAVSILGLLAGLIKIPSRREYAGLTRRP